MMNNSDNKTAIQSAQLRQMLAMSTVSIVTSTLLALVLAYVQYEVIAPAVVIAWFSLIVLVALSRVALALAYKRSFVDSSSATHSRLVRFRFGVLAIGAVWGSAGLLMFPSNDPPHLMFLVFMLAGLSAGGVVSYSADLVSAIGFSVLALAPLVIRLFVAADSLSIEMGLAGLLYLGFMIMSMRHINQNISENIMLRLEASAREEAVRASEERYRLLLTHSPVGIFHYDTSLVITYCNDRFADILHTSTDRIVGLDMKTLKDQAVLPALRKAMEGEIGSYEGRYSATFSDSDGWIGMTCAPSLDGTGGIVGGVAIVQDITERKIAADEIKHLAFYDSLTRLPNRRLLLDRLQQAIASSARSGKKGALMFIDLDNFKKLNDTLGHSIGDVLLQQAAQRLESCVRETDTVARFGGDEFVVVLSELDVDKAESITEASIVAEKIRIALAEPYMLHVQQDSSPRIVEYQCTSSIGVVLFNNHEISAGDILKWADTAMYRAKEGGHNQVRFYE